MPEQILIIDNNTTSLRKLREVLSKEGFGIITVTDKTSAINILLKMKINYIVGEVGLMGLTNFENGEIK
ncbi:MAG: hypothetical protein F9K45_09290 [Melioribacteraceae bacterium]|nr:MAG: hypothetical protein F9K45_09290 [Melioribacteraceae bacterium]